jgi:hypothetical protein
MHFSLEENALKPDIRLQCETTCLIEIAKIKKTYGVITYSFGAIPIDFGKILLMFFFVTIKSP